MKTRSVSLFVVALLLVAGTSWSYWRLLTAGESMTAAGEKYLGSLTAEQRKVSPLEYNTPARLGWHFIPKPERKGLQIRNMSAAQRQAAHDLLRSCLSDVGYDKATKIMAMENLLKDLEKAKTGTPFRDPERYYFTIFGQPAAKSRWGLSIEGHHYSFNFVVDNNKVISTSPVMFGANPATVTVDIPAGVKGVVKGQRTLANEEQLAFDLLGKLNSEQRKKAIIAEKAPNEVRGAGDPQPPQTAPEGIAAGELNDVQWKTLKSLVETYAKNLPGDVAQERLDEIEKAGFAKVHFAWAGADQPGIGHYYRVHGPTFLIEFVNTQADAAGNPANHIHCVWRNPNGDFALPAKP